jgi:hypothetical protein
LNALKAEMSMDENSFTVKYNGKKLTAKFNTEGEFKSLKDLPNFKTYVDLNEDPWLAGDGPGIAYDYYLFSDAKLRPATMELTIEDGILPKV